MIGLPFHPSGSRGLREAFLEGNCGGKDGGGIGSEWPLSLNPRTSPTRSNRGAGGLQSRQKPGRAYAGRSPTMQQGCDAHASAGRGCDVRGRAGRGQSNINPSICNKGARVQSFVLICAVVCGEGSTKNPGYRYGTGCRIYNGVVKCRRSP